MSNSFFIGKRKVGEGSPPLVIAEIGINHGGSLKIAKEMVDAASRAGVEVVKHQTHIPEDEMSPAAKKVFPGNAKSSIWDVIASAALNEQDEWALKDYVESKGMIFLSTPFSRAALERIKKFDLPAIKIGSGECNHYPLIELIAKLGKPVILSTGMNGIESISGAVDILRRYEIPFALMHCTSIYPTPFEKVRLNCLNQLRLAFPDAVLGLSDHSLSNTSCLGAVALGASILERHFTDHKKRLGPDIEVSMDEAECRELIKNSRDLYLCMGKASKEFIPEEEITAKFAFATVVTIEKISKGDLLTEKNIWIKRPGSGEIRASEFAQLINGTFRTVRELKEGEHLSWSDIETNL